MTARYDYVIAGSGSSACVVAARLVKDGARVLMLERGPSNWHPFFKMPAAFVKLLEMPTFVTKYPTVPQAQLGGRVHMIPQANVLGGGGSVNGMVYMRGRPSDYADWVAATGDPRWSYDSLLPAFRAQEGNQRLSGEAHNQAGPLKVSDIADTCELSRLFVETAHRMGLPLNDDFNSGVQTGVGFMQLTTYKGKRVSAYDAFLRDLARDPCLTVVTGARVERIVTDRGRAVGLSYRHDGESTTAMAEREVILAAGTFNTPKLLMLSGIGPADELGALGIDVTADLPGVGRNLQDHHEVPAIFRSKPGLGYYHEDQGLRMLANGANWLFFKRGPVNSIGVESCAFIDPFTSDGVSAEPTLQFYCVPTVYVDHDVAGAPDCPGVTFHSCLLRPKTRGSVRLRSRNPDDDPAIDPNFLGHPDDLAISIAGIRFARRLVENLPLRDALLGELLPGSDATSDEQLAAHCRRTVKTNHHPVGTCRMGRDDDPMAVLSSDLRVRGVDGLRVVDASLFPNIVSGNTHAAVLAAAAVAAGMIADRGPADFHHGRAKAFDLRDPPRLP